MSRADCPAMAPGPWPWCDSRSQGQAAPLHFCQVSCYGSLNLARINREACYFVLCLTPHPALAGVAVGPSRVGWEGTFRAWPGWLRGHGSGADAQRPCCWPAPEEVLGPGEFATELAAGLDSGCEGGAPAYGSCVLSAGGDNIPAQRQAHCSRLLGCWRPGWPLPGAKCTLVRVCVCVARRLPRPSCGPECVSCVSLEQKYVEECRGGRDACLG